ncbi:uncharacterized protein LOC134472714 [Cavia porcellus]|uniref:uncharacterized protein LOC134472714 n=1 Tax=Cavia porcellus TaxID=10141 RepID=UPI002FE04996
MTLSFPAPWASAGQAAVPLQDRRLLEMGGQGFQVEAETHIFSFSPPPPGYVPRLGAGDAIALRFPRPLSRPVDSELQADVRGEEPSPVGPALPVLEPFQLEGQCSSVDQTRGVVVVGGFQDPGSRPSGCAGSAAVRGRGVRGARRARAHLAPLTCRAGRPGRERGDEGARKRQQGPPRPLPPSARLSGERARGSATCSAPEIRGRPCRAPGPGSRRLRASGSRAATWPREETGDRRGARVLRAARSSEQQLKG